MTMIFKLFFGHNSCVGRESCLELDLDVVWMRDRQRYIHQHTCLYRQLCREMKINDLRQSIYNDLPKVPDLTLSYSYELLQRDQ